MIIAKYLGGSHLYGLSTPDSDVDERIIFANTEAKNILGLNKFEQEVRNNKDEDVHKIEIRKFLELARKGNTQSIEVLYAKDYSFDEKSPALDFLRLNREKFVDSNRLFKVISSFIHAQKFLIFDDKRKAEEGSKRATKINQYGYNPKAASTALRLALSGINFFETGHYQVEMTQSSSAAAVKFHPEDFNADNIRTMVESLDNSLKVAYDNTKIKTSFDENFANRFLLVTYMPHLLSEVTAKDLNGNWLKQ